MLSVTPISTAQASTYYQKDSYYAAEKPGEWDGKAAEALELRGEILREDWQRVIEGKNPRTGEQLVQVGANGEHRAATDLTFSAPKSVSVAALVGGRKDIVEAHRAAVDATLKYIEEHGAQARVTKDGVTEKVKSENLIIGKYEHSTSRELDPQLHTHCPIMNMTQMPDGTWKAVSNEKFFENKMYYGQYYRSELAANLKELGYKIESATKGVFEIKKVDKEIRDEYSRRTEQIKGKMDNLRAQYPGANESQLKEYATLGSRAAKDHGVDMRDVRESWSNRLQTHGLSVEQLNKNIDQMMEKGRSRENMSAIDAVRTAANILTEQESTFGREELLRTAAQLTMGDERISGLDKEARCLTRSGDIVPLRDGSYTTKEMQRIERETVQMMRDGRGKCEPVMSREEVREALNDGQQRTESQGGAIEHVLVSSDRVIGIQGYAGVGKTTALDTIRKQLEAHGHSVKGVAYTGKAADGIQSEANIKSSTIAKNQHEGGRADFMIVDEASMAGSRDIHNIIVRAQAEGSRVVLVGDTKQLQAIQAGKIFKDLQSNGMTTTIMPEIIRQKDGTYKDIVRSVVNKKIDDAFLKMTEAEKIHEIPDRSERLAEVARDYANRPDWKSTVVLSGKNTDTRELNTLIRNSLKERGEIGLKDHELTVRMPVSLSPIEQRFAQSYETGQYLFVREAGVGGMKAGSEARIIFVDIDRHTLLVEKSTSEQREINLIKDGGKVSVYEERQEKFSQGEKILFTKNDSHLGVRNGQMGDIQKIDNNGEMIVTMQDGSARYVNPEKYQYINHGDAVTTHKSQSMTQDNAIVHAPADGSQSYNSLYVQTTRGRQDLQVYTDNVDALREQVKIEQEKTTTIRLDKTKETEVRDVGKITDEIQRGGTEHQEACRGHDTGKDSHDHDQESDVANKGCSENLGEDKGRGSGDSSQNQNQEIDR